VPGRRSRGGLLTINKEGEEEEEEEEGLFKAGRRRFHSMPITSDRR